MIAEDVGTSLNEIVTMDNNSSMHFVDRFVNNKTSGCSSAAAFNRKYRLIMYSNGDFFIMEVNGSKTVFLTP